jgi:large subunit ribosomal protein L9
MKIILTQQVAGLGAPGDVVEVKNGYARNFLLPRGYANRWTRGAETQIESLRRARDARDVQTVEAAMAAKSELESHPVTIAAKVGSGGRLFGAVTPAEIADAASAAGGPKIDKRQIEVGSPLKSVGEHQVGVRLHDEVTAQLAVTVVAG